VWDVDETATVAAAGRVDGIEEVKGDEKEKKKVK
jgi:hypothetical protein